jgi:hypothetical protein
MFADTTPTKFASTFKKTEWFKFSPGVHIIRILSDKTRRFDAHWFRFQKSFVQCLGEDCPICENNVKILAEFSEDKAYRKHPQWNPASQLHAMNVLDRTSVKICPKCGAEVLKVGNTFPASCPACNAFITTVSVTPVNKVKLLSKGKEFVDQIIAFLSMNLDTEGNPIPLQSYNIGISVDTAGKPTPGALVNQNDDVTNLYTAEDLWDLESAVMKMDREELINMQNGVAVKDIFNARKSKPTTELEKLASETSSNIQDEIKRLMED